MKRIVSLLTAVIMAATIISFPAAGTAYAVTDSTDNIISEEMTDNEITGGETGDGETSELIDIASEDVTAKLSKTSYVYSGSAFKPVPSLTYNGEALVKDTDYTVSYSGNVNAGKGVVTIKGTGEKYTGTRVLKFTIKAKSLSKAKMTIPYTEYGYKKANIKPVPTVKLGSVKLKKNVDYKVTYKSNRFPGKAKVVVTGIGNYSGSVSKSFYIAKMGKLKLVKRGADSLKLEWGKKNNVTGYKIYMYNASKDKWVLKKTVKGADKTTATITGLKEAYGYKLKIRTYVKDSDGDNHYGSFGPVVSLSTKPGKVSLSKVSANTKMQIKIKWKKERGDGYQIAVSRKSDFSNAVKYNVKKSGTLSKTVKVSKNNKNYYVKVRAYKVIQGKKVYGSWSKAKKVKVDGTGWCTVDGRKYYCKNGKPVKGNQKINGNHYFFGRNSGTLMGVNSKMYNKVKDEKSGTKYLIAVSRTKNRLCVYEKNNGEWVVKYYWKCSTGAPGLISPISKTPAGIYSVPKKTTHKLHFGEEHGYTCWYATRIKKGYYFHSVKYAAYSKTKLKDGRLGYNISNGCVRLSLENAKWIYDNIDAGTKLVIMN